MVYSPLTAYACSCAPSTPDEHFNDADVVFTGKVLQIEQNWNREYEVKFEIEQRQKMEDDEKTVIVRTALTDAECGYIFQTGLTYVVYAGLQDDRLYTDLCSGTHRFLGE